METGSPKFDKARKIVLTSLLAATAVLLSGIHFPVGPSKVFPFQHMVNGLAGVLVGPWYGALAALIAAIFRNALGTGFIGVGLVVTLLGPLMEKEFAFVLFFPAFLLSSIPGTILAFFLLKTLRKTKVLESREFSQL
jgi:predicted membrane protein